MFDLYGAAIRIVVASGLVAAATVFGCAPDAAADWLDEERQLTTGAGTQDSPQLSGANLVYADHPDDADHLDDASIPAHFDIRVLNLRTGRSQNLTPVHTAIGPPAISGDRVVWSDDGTGADQGIRYHNLASGTQRRLDAEPGAKVRISGNRICYEYRGRIHVHHLGTGRDVKISPAGAAAGSCDISGQIVVWQEHRDGQDADIYAYNLDTRARTRLTRTASEPSLPSVDGSLVVWQERVGANVDIYAHDLVSGRTTRVTDDESVQQFADVADGRIVWMDERNAHNTEIYLFDLASGIETRVTNHDGWSGNPAIDGDEIIYQDSRGDGHSLFAHRVTPPRLSLAPLVGSHPLRPVLAGRLVGADGRPVAAETVALELSVGGDWVPAGTALTSQEGGFRISAPTAWGEIAVRARFAGTPEYPGAASPTLKVVGAWGGRGLRVPLP